MKNIYLIGMPGSGKSTLGRKIAEILQVEHLDTDEMITKRAGMSPEDIILHQGELELRKLEHELLLNLLTRENLIISTGGGFPVYDDNMLLMNERGITLYIRYSEEILWSRLQNDRVRPLSSSYEAIVELLGRRKGVYGKASIIIDGEDDILKNTNNAINAISMEFQLETPGCD